MLNKINTTRVMVITGIILCFILVIFTPTIVMAYEREYPLQELTPCILTYPKTILKEEGSLSGDGDEKNHPVNLKAGKEYFFQITFSASCVGLYSIQINRPGEVFGMTGEHEVWTMETPDSDKNLSFSCITDTSGEHTFVVGCGSLSAAGTYSFKIYTIESIEYWWIIIAGAGGLVVLGIIIIVIAVTIRRPKKKKRKKK